MLFFLGTFALAGLFEYYFVAPTFGKILTQDFCGFRGRVSETDSCGLSMPDLGYQSALVCISTMVLVMMSLGIVMVIDNGVCVRPLNPCCRKSFPLFAFVSIVAWHLTFL